MDDVETNNLLQDGKDNHEAISASEKKNLLEEYKKAKDKHKGMVLHSVSKETHHGKLRFFVGRV